MIGEWALFRAANKPISVKYKCMYRIIYLIRLQMFILEEVQ